MSRVSVKSKVISNSINDKKLTEQFAQLLGSGANGDIPDMDVIYPKYRELYTLCKEILTKFAFFQRDFVGKCEDLKHTNYIKEISNYNKLLLEEFKDVFKFKLLEEKLAGMFDHLTDDEKKEFSIIYKNVKEAKIIKRFIVYCKKLSLYKKYLFADPNNVGKHDLEQNSSFVRNPSFISTIALLNVTPFEPDLKFDFKHIFQCYKLNDEQKMLVPDLMATVYVNAHALYKIIITPDIDVDTFVDTLMIQINTIKKQVDRCDGAFTRIEKATGMLKENFAAYYKAFVTSKDPNTILQSFIIDVSKQDAVDAKTAQEFSRILSFFRKKSQKIKDPEANKIVDKLAQHIDMLEDLMGNKNTEMSVDDPTDSNSSSSSSSSSNNSSDVIDSEEHAKKMLNKIKNSEELMKMVPGLEAMLNAENNKPE